jgi:predicted transcriptional regulator
MAQGQISVSLDDDVKQRLEIEARVEGKTLSRMAALFITRALDQRAKRRKHDPDAAQSSAAS